MESDEQLYAMAMEEVVSRNPDAGTMAKAFALANGVPDATVAAYLRLRVEGLKLGLAREASERQQKETAKRQEEDAKRREEQWIARVEARREFDAVQSNVVAVIVFALIGVIAIAAFAQVLAWWFGN